MNETDQELKMAMINVDDYRKSLIEKRESYEAEVIILNELEKKLIAMLTERGISYERVKAL